MTKYGFEVPLEPQTQPEVSLLPLSGVPLQELAKPTIHHKKGARFVRWDREFGTATPNTRSRALSSDEPRYGPKTPEDTPEGPEIYSLKDAPAARICGKTSRRGV